MKATGVVRRIDDLGRIVIPKEIRRNLRIKDGECLEVFVDYNSIILKKYSVMKNMEELACNIVDVLYNDLKKTIIITDGDSVVACSKNVKNKLYNCKISNEICSCIRDRIVVIEKDNKVLNVCNLFSLDCKYVICPIISNSDCVGVVIVSSEDKISEEDVKMCMIAAKILAKSIEE